MYSTSHSTSTAASMNGMRPDLIDGSGTINPAALNSSGVLPPSSTVAPPEPSPRGVKRSRSPESHGDGAGDGDDDDQKPRKRGRPPKTKGSSGNVPESPNLSSPTSATQGRPGQAQTPQTQPSSAQPAAAATPAQVSPTKATPTKPTIKALPTVRDHTTDQLGPEEDEYIPREYDEAGEKKVSPNGVLNDGREYRCRTFYVPNRGEKLFMLATECARVLGYRDSYLLFNKNRSLYKIIATQAEKDDLIHQEILPYSYRSRQIAIVTAKSMFRQFGSRVINGGRRVRDDYWEGKARKQGFTEDDAAGEKRPGAARARDAAAAEAANASANSMMGQHADIVYNNGPHLDPHQQPQAVQPGMGPPSLAPLPMIHLSAADNTRLKDYTNIPRPRQEISGAPYLDQTKLSSTSDILNQAQQTAEYNKSIGQQRSVREKYLDDIWKQPREIASTPQQSSLDHNPSASQSLQSPQAAGLTAGVPQSMMPHQSHGAAHIMPQGYSQSPHSQNPLAQSPARNVSQVPGRPDQLQHRSPGLNIGGPGQSANPYNFSHQSQMWPLTQPPHQHSLTQYSPGPQHPSLHAQSSHQPSHSLQHPQGGSQMQPGPLQYHGMPGGMQGGYGAPGNRAYYAPPTNTQHYMQHTTAGSQPGMQGWAPPQSPHGQNQWGSWGGNP